MTNVLLVGTLATCLILVIAVGRMWSMLKDLTVVTSYMFVYLDNQDDNFTQQKEQANDED